MEGGGGSAGRGGGAVFRLECGGSIGVAQSDMRANGDETGRKGGEKGGRRHPEERVSAKHNDVKSLNLTCHLQCCPGEGCRAE